MLPAIEQHWLARHISSPCSQQQNILHWKPTLPCKTWISGKTSPVPFYGFDHIELARNHTDEAHVGQHYALWMEEKGLSNWRDYYLQPTGHVTAQRRKWLIPEEFHYNNWIAERSNALISEYQAQDQPFFLWASFFDPHPKYLAPEPWGHYV